MTIQWINGEEPRLTGVRFVKSNGGYDLYISGSEACVTVSSDHFADLLPDFVSGITSGYGEILDVEAEYLEVSAK